MSIRCRILSMKVVCTLGCAAVFTSGLVHAQSAARLSPNSTSIPALASGWSSSQTGSLQLAEGAAPASPAAVPAGSSAVPSAPTPARQDNSGNYSGWKGSDLTHRLTFELGAGFNGPIGNDTNQSGVVFQSNGAPEPVPVITWGGNFTLGAGVRFSDRISTLLEYQFMDDKLPGVLIAAVNNATGDVDDISAGNTHINSITGSPVIDLFPKKSNGVYLVGGFGWYHKSTNFQAPEAEISYYGEFYENVTVTSFTSNQWGGNGGFGLYHRIGGMYGESHTQIFAEARYTFIHTPPPSQSNGLGTTEVIPVTVGVRF